MVLPFLPEIEEMEFILLVHKQLWWLWSLLSTFPVEVSLLVIMRSLLNLYWV
jgi:hypothetical protein